MLIFCICVTVIVNLILYDVQYRLCYLVETSGAINIWCRQWVGSACCCDLCLYQRLTQPLPCNQSPRFLRAAIYMWRPPIITTNLSSPYFSGHFQWRCLPMPYNCGSNLTTSVCSTLGCWTAFLTTPIECMTIVNVWAVSWNRGSRAIGQMIFSQHDGHLHGMQPTSRCAPSDSQSSVRRQMQA